METSTSKEMDKKKLFNPRMNTSIKPAPRDTGKYYKKD